MIFVGSGIPFQCQVVSVHLQSVVVSSAISSDVQSMNYEITYAEPEPMEMDDEDEPMEIDDEDEPVEIDDEDEPMEY